MYAVFKINSNGKTEEVEGTLSPTEKECFLKFADGITELTFEDAMNELNNFNNEFGTRNSFSTYFDGLSEDEAKNGIYAINVPYSDTTKYIKKTYFYNAILALRYGFNKFKIGRIVHD